VVGYLSRIKAHIPGGCVLIASRINNGDSVLSSYVFAQNL